MNNLCEKCIDTIRDFQILNISCFMALTFFFRTEIEVRQDRKHESWKPQNRIDLETSYILTRNLLDKILQSNLCKACLY
jgi:hypothetical protein